MRLRRLIPFLLIYVLVHDVTGDSVRSYDGIPQDAITSLLAAQGKTGDFITQSDYLAFVLAHQPAPLTAAQVTDFLRSQALDELNAGIQPPDKVQRAVYLVTLDEINLIRSLLVPAQPARTVTQFKNAVQSKINSGAAD